MSYYSPIEIVKKIQEQYETDVVNNVIKCVQSYGINVDKDELIKALKYDRQQYEKGYHDGIMESKLLADQIKELFPERLTDFETHTQEQHDELCRQAWNRLFDIEDIIYGEEEDK